MANKSEPLSNKPRLTYAKPSKDTGFELGSPSDFSVDAFLLLDEKLNLLNINNEGKKLFGVSEVDAFGKCIVDVIPETKKSGIYKKCRNVLKTGESLVIHQELGDRSLVVEVFKLGNSLGIIASNLTQRKLSEEALQNSEELCSALVKNLTDAVFLFKGSVVTWCNDMVERIYGYPKNELLGKHASFFYPNDINPSKLARTLSSALKEQGLFYGTTKFQKKDGRVVDIEYSLSQIRGKAPIEIMAVARDITERQRADEEREHLLNELAEKTKELEQMVYITSHDLRSPLVNIQGFTRELDESFKQAHQILDSRDVPSAIKKKLAPILGEDIPHAIQYILANSSKMNSLLSGLLRLSRLGRAPLNIKRLDMNRLMAEVVASFEFQVKESGARIMVEGLPPCHGDETQVNQVFSNLLDNALKFLDPDKSGRIMISGKAEKGQVTYCIEDNGIGIADKDRERIFEIFCRLDPDASAGEGLGLAIVRKILDRHSGRVWAESEPGKGSRFFVSLLTKEGTNDKK
jgi:two-component system, chemotaxis family, sensor kinase Cph1